jgi:hypothetical protein
VKHDARGSTDHRREHAEVLNTKAAKERKELSVRFVIFASEFFLADFALKSIWGTKGHGGHKVKSNYWQAAIRQFAALRKSCQ